MQVDVELEPEEKVMEVEEPAADGEDPKNQTEVQEADEK